MFQFPTFAFLTECCIFNATGCPIRKSSDQRLFAPTRSLSQLITSFIASESLGIHHTLLIIYFYCDWYLYQCTLAYSINSCYFKLYALNRLLIYVFNDILNKSLRFVCSSNLNLFNCWFSNEHHVAHVVCKFNLPSSMSKNLISHTRCDIRPIKRKRTS